MAHRADEENAMTEIVSLPTADLHPHPGNPRLAQRTDVVDAIVATIGDGLPERHALTVRRNVAGYEILSGHHRHAAALKANLAAVPCWIVEMDDAAAYLELVRSNAQGELTPLERGMHALRSGMDVKAYAGSVGRAHSNVVREVYAARVASSVSDIGNDLSDRTSHLAELHAAPSWLWPALVAELVAKGWTVEQARGKVGALKSLPEPPPWSDLEAVATAIVTGRMRAGDIERMTQAPAKAKLSSRLAADLDVALHDKRPASLSAVQAIVATFVEMQQDRDRKARGIRQKRQSTREDAERSRAERRERLLDAVSLEEWPNLDAEERRLLLAGVNDRKRTFNQQENADIEWAQWSWNPISGCRHECPYCYARDIAHQKRMAKVYPFGFEPTFRARTLLAPRNMAVPGEANADARYRNVFTCSMADLFGRWVPEEWINSVLREMRAAPDWNFLCLTKFPKRMAEFDIPANVWMGTTVDLQARVPAAEAGFARLKCEVKWLSIEPMLEPLTFTRLDLFDWVVVGGSTKQSKTPEWHPPSQWVHDLRRQAEAAGVAWYEKSNLWGSATARTLQLPNGLPVHPDAGMSAPPEFNYLGR